MHNICEAAINVSNDAIIFRKIDGTITFWNQGAEKLYGWKSEEAINKITHQFLRTVFPLTCLAQQDDLIKLGRWEGDLVHTNKDGDIVEVDSNQIYLKEDDIVLEINRDVMPTRKITECGLLRIIMNSISQGIYVVDMDGTILFYNQAIVRLLGEQALLGSIASVVKSGGIFLPDQVTPWPLAQMPVQRIIDGGPPSGDLMYIKNSQRPEGSWIMVYAYLLKKRDGVSAGAVALVKEVIEASGKGLPSIDLNVPNFPI